MDNILHIHGDPDSVLIKLDKYFLLKPDFESEPDVYLRAKMELMQLKNGVWKFGLSPSKYMKDAVCNCKKYVRRELA